MKKLIVVLLAVIFVSCEKNDDPEVKFRIDPNAKVYVKASTGSSKTISIKSTQHLAPIDVVKQATYLRGYNYEVAGTSHITWTWVGKDTISNPPALLRWANDIIHDTTGYGDFGIQKEFINSVDLVICRGTIPNYDTIAYIPNSNMSTAKDLIIKAFNDKDTAAVYRVFKDAFKFIPITGSEWRELKKNNAN